MKVWLACVGVGTLAVCAETAVFAQDAGPEMKEDKAATTSNNDEVREEAVREAQVFRVNAGAAMGTLSAGSLGPLSSAGAGSLGGLAPTVSLTAGPRLGGPLWLVFGVEGSVLEISNGDVGARVWGAGGSLGVRLDVPILPKVELGGSATSRVSTQFGPDWDSLSVSGHIGLGLHLRPTSFFGIRTDVEVFRVGYASADGLSGSGHEVIAAEIHAAPSLSLTFSF